MFCRTCIIAHMTKEQLYSMRMEVADYLEANGPECATCKSKRTEGIDFEGSEDQPARRYNTCFFHYGEFCQVSKNRVKFRHSVFEHIVSQQKQIFVSPTNFLCLYL